MATHSVAQGATPAQDHIQRVRLPYGGVKLCHAGQAVVLTEGKTGLHAFVSLGAVEQYLGQVVGASLALPDETLWRAVMRNGGKL